MLHDGDGLAFKELGLRLRNGLAGAVGDRDRRLSAFGEGVGIGLGFAETDELRVRANSVDEVEPRVALHAGNPGIAFEMLPADRLRAVVVTEFELAISAGVEVDAVGVAVGGGPRSCARRLRTRRRRLGQSRAREPDLVHQLGALAVPAGAGPTR